MTYRSYKYVVTLYSHNFLSRECRVKPIRVKPLKKHCSQPDHEKPISVIMSSWGFLVDATTENTATYIYKPDNALIVNIQCMSSLLYRSWTDLLSVYCAKYFSDSIYHYLFIVDHSDLFFIVPLYSSRLPPYTRTTTHPCNAFLSSNNNIIGGEI